MIQVAWHRPNHAEWHELMTVRFSSKIRSEGVYIIWVDVPNDRPYCIDVGQGQNGPRITWHQGDPDILHYRQYGILRFTWAELQAGLRDGVERYLADALKPLAGRRYPDVVPIPVNLPAVA